METQAEVVPAGNTTSRPVFATPTAGASARRRTRTEINVTPSPKTVVNSGDFSYFSDKGMSPLPYALSEFVDNSLAAINTRMAADSATSLVPNIIAGDIRISFDKSDKLSTVIIWDNGCGMNIDTLKNFAIFALSPEDRLAKLNAITKKPSQQAFLSEFYSNPLRINTNISMFGVGAKMSAFFIGQDLIVVTKCSDSEEVLEYRCNRSIISEYSDSGISCYNKSINHRAPGAVADSELSTEAAAIARVKNYIEVMEKQHKSFTYAVISSVKKDFIARFEKSPRETAFSLAEVYHWYLHGHPTMKTSIGGNVSMSLSVNNLPTLDIKAIPSVVKEQIARKKDTFSFEIVDSTNDIAVFGFAHYFPFDDVETCPKESKILAQWNGAIEPESDDEDDDADANSNESDPSQQSVPPIFSCWWQGRLIPMTTVESLKWMGSSFKTTTSRCRYRVKGCLFFDRIFKVTQNKSTFTEDLRNILERPSAVIQLVDNQKGPIAKQPRSNRTVEDAFKDWIKSCHDRYDKEVQLRKKRSEGHHDRWRLWLEYEEMVITGKETKSQHEFKANDIVRIKCQSAKKPRFGKIVKFLRANPSAADDFETHPDAAFVSGSDRGLKCQIQALPDFCYPNPKDKLIFVKLRMIDKTTAKDEVLRQLEVLKRQQMKHIPRRLSFHIYELGYIPGKVPAGYKFPNVDIQILSDSNEPLINIPFDGTKKLKARQRFFVKKQGGLQELQCFDGISQEKVFSFWEINTLFKKCGFYSCVFDITNYVSLLEDATLTKSYDFQVVPGPPASVTISKSSANPLTISLGASSTGEQSVQFTDQFKNVCTPDDIFLNNLILSHEHLLVKPKPFKVINGNVIIANVYTEPMSAEGGGFVKFNPNEITSLDIGVRGRPDVIGTIPVKLTLGEPSGMAWATEDNRPLRVTSGGSLSSLRIQLVDRYGLPAKPTPAIKSLTLRLLDSNSRLNGVSGRPVPVPDLSDPSGLILLPVMQINSGLDRVTLRASLLIKKPNVSGRTIELNRDIIVQPGNMLGRVKLSIANEIDEIPSVVVGSKHSLQVDLFGENGQSWQKPYSEQICRRYQLLYNGESFPLTPLGVIPNVVNFPQQIQNPFKVSATVIELSEDSVSIPFQCQTQVTLCPDVGVEWKATVMRPIRCGEPIGDAIQIRYLDRFGNACKIDPNAGTVVSFGGQHGQPSIQGSQMANFDAVMTCLTYPGIILVGHGPGYIVFVDRQPLAKFEIVEGPPCSLVLNLSSDLRSFQQILSENSTDIDVPIISRSKRDFNIHALDTAGSIVSYPPNIQIACKDATVTPKSAPHPYKKSFQMSFNVPVRQQTVTVTIACDRIPRPMVCVFPVQPWLQGVSAINMDPIPPAVVAGAPFPAIAGHILDGAGNPILLHQNPDLLSSLSLALSNMDNNRDLAKDVFGPPVFRDTDGAFAFIARDAVTMAGIYSISVIYTEKRADVLEMLDPAHLSLRSTALVLRINPGPPARLFIDAPASEEPSVTARPIPKLLTISVQDDFGNAVPHRFSQADAVKLELQIVRQDKEHLTRPVLSIDSFGRIVVESLAPNPDRPLQDGTYFLRFRVLTYPNLQSCSLEFFYSSNFRAISEYKELTAWEEKLSADLSSLKQELHAASEAASVVTDRLDTCRDSCRAIISRHFSVGQEVDLVRDLNQSRSRLNTLRAEIARSTRPALVGSGNHQRLQNMREFIGIMGLLGNCSNDEDCRLVSYALGAKISAPVFHAISSDDSRRLNMRHFALDCMPNRGDPTPSLARHKSVFNQYGRQWSTDPVPLLDLFHPDPNISPDLFSEIFVGLLGKILACRTYDDAMAFKKFCVRHRLPCGNILTYDGRTVATTGELGGTIPEFGKMSCRVGVEPRKLREQLVTCGKRIEDLEHHQRLAAEERQLCEQQNAGSDNINSIEQRIIEKEKALEDVRRQIEAADPNSSTTRRRRRASAGPTARGDGPAARRRRLE